MAKGGTIYPTMRTARPEFSTVLPGKDWSTSTCSALPPRDNSSPFLMQWNLLLIRLTDFYLYVTHSHLYTSIRNIRLMIRHIWPHNLNNQSTRVPNYLKVGIFFVLSQLGASSKLCKFLLKNIGTLPLLENLLLIGIIRLLTALDDKIFDTELLKDVPSIDPSSICPIIFASRYRAEVFLSEFGQKVVMGLDC